MLNDRSSLVEFIVKVFIAFLSNAIARIHRDVGFDTELCQDRANNRSIESRISVEENAVNINVSVEEQGDDFAEHLFDFKGIVMLTTSGSGKTQRCTIGIAQNSDVGCFATLPLLIPHRLSASFGWRMRGIQLSRAEIDVPRMCPKEVHKHLLPRTILNPLTVMMIDT